MAPPDDTAAVRPRPACWGKTFEHHGRIAPTMLGSGWWRCADCGTTGDGRDIFDLLAPLGGLADQLQAVTGHTLAILLPSDAPPGQIGHFAGYELYRVQGLPRPMVAIRPPW